MTVYPSGVANNHMATPGVDHEAEDQNFSFADAEKVAALLLEQSRRSKSRFFKAQQVRRPLKERRALSELCLFKGIQAPSSTPDTLHLTRNSSTRSTGSTRSCIEIKYQASKVSLAHTISTSAESESPVKTSLELFKPPESSKCQIADSSPVVTPTLTPCLGGNLSFHYGWDLLQAKIRKVARLLQVWVPSHRAKIREGKQHPDYRPVVGNAPKPPKEFLDAAFLRPSTSRAFENLNLQGGMEAPKYISEKDLDRLDEIDREEAKRLKELARLKKEREMIMQRVEFEGHNKDHKNVKGAKKDKQKRGSHEGKKPEILVAPGSVFNRVVATR